MKFFTTFLAAMSLPVAVAVASTKDETDKFKNALSGLKNVLPAASIAKLSEGVRSLRGGRQLLETDDLVALLTQILEAAVTQQSSSAVKPASDSVWTCGWSDDPALPWMAMGKSGKSELAGTAGPAKSAKSGWAGWSDTSAKSAKSASVGSAKSAKGGKGSKSMQGGPVLREYSLEAKETIVDLLGTRQPMWTYCLTGQDDTCGVPGPLLKGNVGDTLRVHFTNNLAVPTTVHWHGVELPANMDGSPIAQEEIAPGGTFVYEFELLNSAMHWYHSHIDTPVQTELGLYGPLVIHDPKVDKLLPSDDRILFLDDVLLGEAEGPNKGRILPFAFDDINSESTVKEALELSYGSTLECNGVECLDLYKVHQQLNGRYGNKLVVNNKAVPLQGPVATVGKPIRLRLIIPSNTRFFRLSVPADQADVWRIGGDGGLFEKPVMIKPIGVTGDISDPEEESQLILTPGERAELIVVPKKAGVIDLEWHDTSIGFHDIFLKEDPLCGVGAGHSNRIDGNRPKQVLYRMTAEDNQWDGDGYAYAPPELVKVDTLTPDDSLGPVEFAFAHSGAPCDTSVVPFYAQAGSPPLGFDDIEPEDAPTVTVGTTRRIIVDNKDAYDHNFHQHGFFFQHLSTTSVTLDEDENPVSTTTYPLTLENQDTIRIKKRPAGGGTYTRYELVVQFQRGPGARGEDGVCASGKEPPAGGWLVHCHMLAHAAGGMQSFIQVEGCGV